VLGAERERPAFHGVVHRGRPAVELAPDGRANEVGAVGVEALVDEQINLAEVDQPTLIVIFSLLSTSATACSFHPVAILSPSSGMANSPCAG
jgi:hypothetical protein